MSYRRPTTMGPTGDSGTFDHAETVIDTALFVNVGGSMVWSPSAQTDIQAGASIQTLGSDTRRFAALGLEELTPQPGWTGTLSWRQRW